MVKARAALLSDFEVLQQFQSQHEDNKKITEAIAEQKAAIKAKQDGDWRLMRQYDPITPQKKREQKNSAIRGVTDDLLFVTEQASGFMFISALTPGMHAYTWQTGQRIPVWSSQLRKAAESARNSEVTTRSSAVQVDESRRITDHQPSAEENYRTLFSECSELGAGVPLNDSP